MTTIHITPTGTVRFLGGTAPAGLETEGHVTKQRASHIEPTHCLLRVLFHIVRRMVSDDGQIAAITRRWSCTWRVNIIGGPVWGCFHHRQSAIDAEREWLEREGF